MKAARLLGRPRSCLDRRPAQRAWRIAVAAVRRLQPGRFRNCATCGRSEMLVSK